MGRGVAVGIDVGATKLAAGLVSSDGTVLERRRRDTPAEDADHIVMAVAELVEELTSAHDLTDLPVGVGAAGLIDRDGVVRYAPNIRWADYPLRRALAERLGGRLGGRLTVHNDGNAAAWGEFMCGSGRDAREGLVMLTIGTGVGGGAVLGGRLSRGAHGVGAEFGHLIVAEGGPACPCGNRGCLEALASGTAIGRRATERRDAGDLPADSVLRRRARLTGKAVTVAAHDGDAAAREILAEAGFWLGVGIASLVNALDPEVVVLGGGAMQAGSLVLEPARVACSERVIGGEHRTLPQITWAELGDEGGLVGAALLAVGD